ncbi:hypothetical protein ABZW18_00475 [Streptomyces sp. NPDC004647]|uniref:hypothetical protein n=1 Tax=Streptomyces sp. NPDC004647 TaxID=3154671 RepID=UPI0033BDD187
MAVAETVPVVLLGSLGRVPDRTARRVAAVLRRNRTLLLVAGPWDGAQLRAEVTHASWVGVGQGHGLLRGRRATVMVSGRGAAAAERAVDLWLPGPDGTARPISDPSDARPGPRPALRTVG